MSKRDITILLKVATLLTAVAANWFTPLLVGLPVVHGIRVWVRQYVIRFNLTCLFSARLCCAGHSTRYETIKQYRVEMSISQEQESAALLRKKKAQAKKRNAGEWGLSSSLNGELLNLYEARMSLTRSPTQLVVVARWCYWPNGLVVSQVFVNRICFYGFS